MEQPIVADVRAMDAEPGELDVGALVDALLGEMRAVTRYALLVRVRDVDVKLFTDPHVRSEHDRHLFAESLLELLGAPVGSLVAVQRLSLRATNVLARDGRAPRVQRSHDLLQVVVADEHTARAVVREASAAYDDSTLGVCALLSTTLCPSVSLAS